MEVKKIVEGMTAVEVAEVIDSNFKNQNKILEEDIAKQNNVIGVSEYKDFSEAEAVNVGDVRKYNGFLYECVEATTGAFDASKWKKSSFKAETEKKLSELGSHTKKNKVQATFLGGKSSSVYYVYGYTAIADEKGYVREILNEDGKNSTEKKGEPYFVLMDDDGFVSFAVDRDGTIYDSSEVEVNRISNETNLIKASTLIISGCVVSPTRYIHAFSVYSHITNKGDILLFYGASETELDEEGRTRDWHLVLSKSNICDPKNVKTIDVANTGKTDNGFKIDVPYNSTLIGSNDEDYVYCNFGALLNDAQTPTLCTKKINVNDLAGNPLEVNTLSYNGKTVVFTAQSFLDMVYELGLSDSHIIYDVLKYNTMDNPKPFYYNGIYYKVQNNIISDSKIVVLTSTDMTNWSFYGSINKTLMSGEHSLVISDNVMYISYRGVANVGYIICRIEDLSIINDGLFSETILSKPCSFIFRGKPYTAITSKPIYYGNKNTNASDLQNRQEIVLYAFDNSIPTQVVRIANPDGINYPDIIEYKGQSHWYYGDFEGLSKLHMVCSEDKRKIYQVRQFSDILFTDITSLLI